MCVFSDSCVFAVTTVCVFLVIVFVCLERQFVGACAVANVYVFTVISGCVFTLRSVLCVYTDKCLRVYSG